MYMYMHMYICTPMYVYIYMYICIYIYMYTFIYVYVYIIRMYSLLDLTHFSTEATAPPSYHTFMSNTHVTYSCVT